jgi:UDPglucose--hexose-1-phosphate uridylyltransferase
MTQLRTDALTGRQVLVAPARRSRPHTVQELDPVAATPADCPFCPDHEHETPPEVARTGAGAPNTPGWRVRVVPNLYPIVDAGAAGESDQVAGVHEVVVLCSEHDEDLGEITADQAVEVVTVLRDRARVHAAAGFAHVQAFVNHGRAAGASIEHPHAQVVATSAVPPAVIDSIARFTAARSDLVSVEMAAAPIAGVLLFDGPAAAWCAPNGACPYETRVSLATEGARFDEADDAAIDAAARAVNVVLGAMIRVLGDVPYNVVFHTGPTHDVGPFHWYVSIIPRVSVLAGFEIGTGWFVNTVEPTTAATQLRAALR